MARVIHASTLQEGGGPDELARYPENFVVLGIEYLRLYHFATDGLLTCIIQNEQ